MTFVDSMNVAKFEMFIVQPRRGVFVTAHDAPAPQASGWVSA